MGPPVGRRLRAVEEEALNAAAALIVRTDGVMSGDPIAEGTRVRPLAVVAEVLAGRTDEEIHRSYPTLPPRSVEACLHWAAAEVLREMERRGIAK